MSQGPPGANIAYLPSVQRLLLFNFPRPSRSGGGCALPARGARSRRLRSPSGLHVHLTPPPLSRHCARGPCGRHLLADGTCGPGMPPLHPGQVREPQLRGVRWHPGCQGQRPGFGNGTKIHRTVPSYEPLGISLRPLAAEPPTPPMAPPPGSPRRSEGHPDPPTESRSCSQGSPDPKACNWKKYKFIVLNSQASQAGSLAGERSSGQLCPQAGLPSGDEASSSSGSEEGPIPGPQSRYGNWNLKNW